MKPRSWIKLVLFTLPPLLLVGLIALILSVRTAAPPQPTPIPSTLAPNSETRVDVNPGNTPHLYNFTATRLKLISRTPGFAFSAEIRDASGKAVATFDNHLQDLQLTLAPAYAQYQIAVTGADSLSAGTISLELDNAIIAPPTLDGTAQRAADCRVSNATSSDVLVRSAPASSFAVLGTLGPQNVLAALGRTDNGWYAVDLAERLGWINGGVLALLGDCATLATVRDPTIPSAPHDADAYLLQVDRDGSGVFHDAISAPDGDSSDLIWVRVINLYTSPPNNYREFALTLACSGTGAASVRWGSAYGPTLTCGQSVVMPFLSGSAQQPLVVVLPPGSPQSYVEYTLSVFPAAAVG